MTTEVERLLPLVDQFLKAKPEGVLDDDWFKAGIIAAASAWIPSTHDLPRLLLARMNWADEMNRIWRETQQHVLWVKSIEGRDHG